MYYILFILITAGFTSIVVDGSILDKVRPKWELFKCYQCCGFHNGIFVFFMFWFSGIKLWPNWWLGWFLFALLGSFTSLFLNSIFDDWGIKFSKHNDS